MTRASVTGPGADVAGFQQRTAAYQTSVTCCMASPLNWLVFWGTSSMWKIPDKVFHLPSNVSTETWYKCWKMQPSTALIINANITHSCYPVFIKSLFWTNQSGILFLFLGPRKEWEGDSLTFIVSQNDSSSQILFGSCHYRRSVCRRLCLSSTDVYLMYVMFILIYILAETVTS